MAAKDKGSSSLFSSSYKYFSFKSALFYGENCLLLFWFFSRNCMPEFILFPSGEKCLSYIDER
jgi:hypothetical protein